MANDLPLYTCTPINLTGLEELRVVVVPHPDSIGETQPGLGGGGYRKVAADI